ncbi:hypothetical protein ACROYT_G018341 [Oculina patagonica]
MRETLYEIKPKSSGTPYKDWATTVKEARARQIPIGLPQNLKNYFENALKKPPLSNMFGGDPAQAHAQRRSRDARKARKTVFSHVGRNNPHPTIHFPFQTGDRLQTYMVWIPAEPADKGSSCSLPPVPHKTHGERTPPSRNCQSKMNRNFGQFTGLYQTTYQEEIARTPFLQRNVNMADHFPGSNRSSSHRLRVR